MPAPPFFGCLSLHCSCLCMVWPARVCMLFQHVYASLSQLSSQLNCLGSIHLTGFSSRPTHHSSTLDSSHLKAQTKTVARLCALSQARTTTQAPGSMAMQQQLRQHQHPPLQRARDGGPPHLLQPRCRRCLSRWGLCVMVAPMVMCGLCVWSDWLRGLLCPYDRGCPSRPCA